jgi:hypothetical protein
MKKTYQTSHKYQKLKKSRNVHKKNKSRKIQRGGTDEYEIEYSRDSNTVFITHKIKPHILYKIDLPSKTFAIFTSSVPYQDYPLEKKYSTSLFHILSDAKRNDPNFDELLTMRGIDNVEYYPYDRYNVPRVGRKPKTYTSKLRKIEEVQEESLETPAKNSPRRNRKKESLVTALRFVDVAPSNVASSSARPVPIKVQPHSPSIVRSVPVLRLPSRRAFKP